MIEDEGSETQETENDETEETAEVSEEAAAAEQAAEAEEQRLAAEADALAEAEADIPITDGMKIRMRATAGTPKGVLMKGLCYEVDAKTAEKYLSGGYAEVAPEDAVITEIKILRQKEGERAVSIGS